MAKTQVKRPVNKTAKAIPATKEDAELKALGKRLKELRVAAKYSSAEKFALDHGLSRVQYGRWESGKRNINYKNLKRLSRAFGTTVSELTKGL